MLVSNGADARAFRHEPPKVVSALAGMVINSAEMVTRLTKVIWSIAKTIGVLRCAIHLVVKSYGEIGKKMRELVPPTAALGNEKSVSTLPIGFVYTLL